MVKVTSNADRSIMLPYTDSMGAKSYLFLDYRGHEVFVPDDQCYSQLISFGYGDKVTVEVVS